MLGMGNTNKDSNMDPHSDLDNYSYQWIKGDSVGYVHHYKEVIEVNGQQYLVFTDGSRISLALLDEYMVKVEKGFYETAFDKVEPAKQAPNTSKRAGRSELHTIVKEESAIASLLKKQKENWVDVDLNLTINLPKKALWDVIISSFENAEDEIIDYVTKDLDIEVVRDALKKAIKDIYLAKITPVKNVRTQNTIPGQAD